MNCQGTGNNPTHEGQPRDEEAIVARSATHTTSPGLISTTKIREKCRPDRYIGVADLPLPACGRQGNATNVAKRIKAD
jgi:hypothetical protein